MDHLSSNNDASGAARADPVQASWTRCRNFGQQPSEPPGFGTIAKQDLETRRNQHAELLVATENEVLPYFDNMLHNTQCLVVLADVDGAILQTWQPMKQPMATFDGFRPGNVWNEASAGTNAIGTSLASRHAVHVRGDQHYNRSHHHLAGSATQFLTQMVASSALLPCVQQQKCPATTPWAWSNSCLMALRIV